MAQPIDAEGNEHGNHLVAVDTVDAGFGEVGLIVSGSSARMAAALKDTPVDAAIELILNVCLLLALGFLLLGGMDLEKYRISFVLVIPLLLPR